MPFVIFCLFIFFECSALFARVIDNAEIQQWILLDNDERSYLLPLFSQEPKTTNFVRSSFWDSMNWKKKKATHDFQKNPQVQLAMKTFKLFHPLNTVISSIPHIFHFIWLGSPLSERTKSIIGSFAKHHPDWEVNVWTDDDMENFPWSSIQSQSIFSKLSTWSGKSDVLRYEILYRFGGVYVDTDFICLKPFDSIVFNNVDFFAGIQRNHSHEGMIASGLIGSIPNHIILKNCIEHLKELDQKGDALMPTQTGPLTFSQMCYNALAENEPKILILPCSYFYPLPLNSRKETPSKIVSYICLESYCVHLWDGSWVKKN